jgi:hypothetical protein
VSGMMNGDQNLINFKSFIRNIHKFST